MTNLAVGDQVVIPFQISCGNCYMCDQQLFTLTECPSVSRGLRLAACNRSISINMAAISPTSSAT